MPIIAIPKSLKEQFVHEPIATIVNYGAYPLEPEYWEIQRLKEKMRKKRADANNRDSR